jgi:hypothetical protein
MRSILPLGTTLLLILTLSGCAIVFFPYTRTGYTLQSLDDMVVSNSEAHSLRSEPQTKAGVTRFRYPFLVSNRSKSDSYQLLLTEAQFSAAGVKGFPVCIALGATSAQVTELKAGEQMSVQCEVSIPVDQAGTLKSKDTDGDLEIPYVKGSAVREGASRKKIGFKYRLTVEDFE